MHQYTSLCFNQPLLNLLLLFLALFFCITVFHFYFSIFLPNELFEVQLLTKSRTAVVCNLLKVFQHCIFKLFVYTYMSVARLVSINFTYLHIYPYEMPVLWLFLMHLTLCPDIHPNSDPIHPINNYWEDFFHLQNAPSPTI